TPVVTPAGAGVPALGEEVHLVPARAEGLADEDLAVLVALGGIDHVEAVVERAAEQPLHRPEARALVTDLRAPEAEDADLHVGSTQPPLLHRSVSLARDETGEWLSSLAPLRPSIGHLPRRSNLGGSWPEARAPGEPGPAGRLPLSTRRVLRFSV